ncbi:hypothetical protein ACFYYD_06660 [Streptomyces bluensis]
MAQDSSEFCAVGFSGLGALMVIDSVDPRSGLIPLLPTVRLLYVLAAKDA